MNGQPSNYRHEHEPTMRRLRDNALRHLAAYNIPPDVLDGAIEAIIGTWMVMQSERKEPSA